MDKIFIQIASYRDPQLNPTIKSCIDNAKYPENLVFGICNQYHPEDEFNIDEYKNDERFKVVDVLYSDSLGACWARNTLQQRYSGETYTLQIDSHMRFAENWDDEIIKMYNQLLDKGVEKPLLTGYVSSFNPNNDPNERINDPWEMAFDRFIPEGTVFTLPQTIPNWKNLTEPIPTRFYSAHFCFTLGQFALEVQHDPDYYFHGEEISISVRAYTHGYDLFHLHRVIIWHYYTRKGSTKQWDDDPVWHKRNEYSHYKNRKLFGMEDDGNSIDFGDFGFGKNRTLDQYERYAGISFSKRAIQKFTLEYNHPPNPHIEDQVEYDNSFTFQFKHCIDVGFHDVPHDDYTFWAVAFLDENDNEIFRQDAGSDEIKRMKNDPDGYCKIWRTFETTVKPHKWIVWPCSEKHGFGERLEGKL